MDVRAAVAARRSIRYFLPRPVARETVEAVLKTALRAPSAMNTQPWKITVVTGEPLRALAKENEAKLLAGVPFDFDPPYPGVYNQRRVTLGRGLLTYMGIAREDKEGRLAWNLRGFRYFDAPVALIISREKALDGTWSDMDAGGLTQTLCLAALEHGLGTCLEVQGVHYGDTVRKHTGLTGDDVLLVSIALGYPDPEARANQFESERAPLEELTRWVGY